MFLLYRFILFLWTPFIYIYLYFRYIKGKEDKERFKERLGYANLARPQGRLFWFHAASVGEVNSILPLLEKMQQVYKNVNIMVTTGTVTSAKLASERLPKGCFHQYVPVDMRHAVKRFVKYWKPEAAFWVESELWPNLIMMTKHSGCTMILINARISDRSYKKWKRWKLMAQRILSCFTLCMPQTEEDGLRLQHLGAPHTLFKGNLKADARPLPADPKAYSDLLKYMGERLVWLAASTHEGEEIIIADIHKKLKQAHENILTIIVPRHPERGTKIRNELNKLKLNICQRSMNEPVTGLTDIYLADTMGELGLFYRLSEVVFMGGSLVKHGGQNPLEPARLECAIITGPHCFNFQNIYREMESEQAALIVENQEKLAFVVSKLFFDYESRNKLSEKAFAYIEAKRGITDAYIKEIKQYVSTAA